MQYSSRLPVAVHILLCIDKFKNDYKITSNFLAGSTGVNPVIIRKTLGQLKAAGLVTVEPGIGGASLAKEPTDITLLDVFQAVEQEESLFSFHDNPNPECPVGRNIHSVLDSRFTLLHNEMYKSLKTVTLQSLLNDINNILAKE